MKKFLPNFGLLSAFVLLPLCGCGEAPPADNNVLSSTDKIKQVERSKVEMAAREHQYRVGLNAAASARKQAAGVVQAKKNADQETLRMAKLRLKVYKNTLVAAHASAVVTDLGYGGDDTEMTITVNDAFFYQPYQLRLEFAQSLWKYWAMIRSASDLDKAKITIKDRNGNNVGGSSSMAGSIVSMQQ